MFFHKKNEKNSEEIEKLHEKVRDLTLKISDLETKFLSLRGLVYRKVYPEPIKPETEKKEGLYMGVCLPEDGYSK